jgi:hypothetical protein
MSDLAPETPDQFLETEEILQGLILQLEEYKSTSEQLTLAREDVGELLRSCDRLAALCGQLIERNKQQLDATVKLAADSETRANLMLDGQQASAALTKDKLNDLAATLATHGTSIISIADITEQRINHILDGQRAAAASSDEKFNSLTATLSTQGKDIDKIHDNLETQSEQVKSIEGTLQHMQASISGIRLFVLILLTLTLINGFLAAYILRLLTN